MNRNTILQAMESYVVEHTSATAVSDIADLQVIDVLVSSFEVLDFTMELEDTLELAEDMLDITELSSKFATLNLCRIGR